MQFNFCYLLNKINSVSYYYANADNNPKIRRKKNCKTIFFLVKMTRCWFRMFITISKTMLTDKINILNFKNVEIMLIYVVDYNVDFYAYCQMAKNRKMSIRHVPFDYSLIFVQPYKASTISYVLINNYQRDVLKFCIRKRLYIKRYKCNK